VIFMPEPATAVLKPSLLLFTTSVDVAAKNESQSEAATPSVKVAVEVK